VSLLDFCKEEISKYFKLTVIVSLTDVTFDMWTNTSVILIYNIKLTVIVSLTEVIFDMWTNTSAILMTSILVNISGLEV